MSKENEIEIAKDKIRVVCGAYNSKKGGQYFACKIYFTDSKNNEYWKIVSFDLPEVAKIAGLSLYDFINAVSEKV